MKYLILLLGIYCFFNSCTPTPPENSLPTGWQAVYQHDPQGNPIMGSKEQLIEGIRQGYSLRIGWGWERERADTMLRLEHVADPVFVSILQEKDVSAIIDIHPLLQSYYQIDQQSFREGGHLWQCVMTTKGTFNAKVYDRTTGDLLRDMPQRHRMTWFIEYPSVSQRDTLLPSLF